MPRSAKIKSLRKPSTKDIWAECFTKKLAITHKRNISIKVQKLLKKIDGAKNSMVSRSKKYNVLCDITVEQLRKLTFDAYGTPCKYFPDRILTIENLVFDHIVPVSKGGESTIDNIQIISRFANNVKGSLNEILFLALLNWLNTVDVDLKKDILIRLAHGLH